MLEYLDGSIRGAVVADCGCGPGLATRRMISEGASKVCAIDASKEMLALIAEDTHIVKLQSTLEELPLDKLRESEAPEGFDLVLFKRSLYMSTPEALEILKNAFGHLRQGGCLVVVHPEKTLRPYFFGSPPWFHRYTIPHIINRASNCLGVLMGVEKYQLYTRKELKALAEEVAGIAEVEAIPSSQQSFNMVAIRNSEEKS